MDFKEVSKNIWEFKEDGMNVPLRVVAGKSLLDKMQSDRTIKQAVNVSKLPGLAGSVFVMPDGHEGYGFPIGGVAGFGENGVISPGGVGYDINCGVRLLSTGLSVEEVKPKLKEIVEGLYSNIPVGVGSKSKIHLKPAELDEVLVQGAEWAVEKGMGEKRDLKFCEEEGKMRGADPSKISGLAKQRGGPQLGTLGSGNHFLEVQLVEKIFDEKTAKKFGVEEELTSVMVHTGSRGFGHQICEDYVRKMLSVEQKYNLNLPDNELACAPIGSEEADDYLKAMGCAVNYAFCNRQVITSWVRDVFYKVFPESDLKLVYDVAHNIAKFEEHEINGEKKNICVHRKGATRAFWKGRKEIPSEYRSIGQPVIIPGSMNTSSFLLLGLEGAKQTFGSSCHGAGRVMSRHEALRTFEGGALKKSMEEKGQIVRAPSLKGLAEEAGGAYKNVDEVVKSVEDAGISRIIAKMKPLGVIKG
jgi:tRNA-splicing ligase RtcB